MSCVEQIDFFFFPFFSWPLWNGKNAGIYNSNNNIDGKRRNNRTPRPTRTHMQTRTHKSAKGILSFLIRSCALSLSTLQSDRDIPATIFWYANFYMGVNIIGKFGIITVSFILSFRTRLKLIDIFGRKTTVSKSIEINRKLFFFFSRESSTFFTKKKRKGDYIWWCDGYPPGYVPFSGRTFGQSIRFVLFSRREVKRG